MKLVFELLAKTEEDLISAIAKLASILKEPSWLWLQGEMGSGKTTFVRHLLHYWKVKEPINSPTYTLLHEYSLGQSTVYHIDAYRLGSLGEPPWDSEPLLRSFVFVEWAEHLSYPMTFYRWFLKITGPDEFGIRKFLLYEREETDAIETIREKVWDFTS